MTSIVPVTALTARHRNSRLECQRFPLLLPSPFSGTISRLELLQLNPIILLRNWGMPYHNRYYYGAVCSFLPDFTEHPKPKPKRPNTAVVVNDTPQPRNGDGSKPPPLPPDATSSDTTSAVIKDEDITFFHDFVSGGVAGSASVVVGHPFDTIKTRMQAAVVHTGLLQTIREFGGVTSLFRGLSAPLYAASAINALVFGSYGLSSRLYDVYVVPPVDYYTSTTAIARAEAEPVDNVASTTHDPWQKAWLCGSFSGGVQCIILCPIEHIKCRLQTQKSTGPQQYTGSVQTGQKIFAEHGLQRLYQGFWATFWREVPAFGMYFATYDYLKDRANAFLSANDPSSRTHHHQWVASAFAGGCSGCLTWTLVYPVDVIKTQIQTAPLDAPRSSLRLLTVGQQIVQRHGVGILFRGLGITLVRAFPVNGTIFPVYEFTLQKIMQLGY